MESRKVQLAGGSTFTVSLPKEWAREHGVDAGSELRLQANGDGTLLVRTDPDEGREGRPTVDADAHDAVALDALVRALYVAGHPEFALTGERTDAPEGRRAVEAAARELVGLAVVETGDGRVVLRNALDPDDVSLDQTLLQLRRAACEGFEAAATAALAGEGGGEEGFADRTAEVDRLFGVVARSFRRALVDGREVDRLGADRPHLFETYRAAEALARTGREASRLAGDGRGGRPPLAEDLESYATDAARLLSDATDVLRDGSAPDEAGALLHRRDRLRRRGESLQRSMADRDVGCGDPAAAVHRSAGDVADRAARIGETAVLRGLREKR